MTVDTMTSTADATRSGRYVGGWPKIGIRPAIDGRRSGVRESLEEPDHGHGAGRGRASLRANLRHPNGLPVECVIADTCIGGVAEAARVRREVRAARASASRSPSRPAGATARETMDMDPLMPKAVWGFNGTERPGAVYLAAVLAGHNQKGLPAFGIYGRDVQDAGDTDDPRRRAGEAAALRPRRPGRRHHARQVATSRWAASRWASPARSSTRPSSSSYLGMRVESVDMTEFVRRIEEKIYDQDEFERALAWVRSELPGRQGLQPAEQPARRRARRTGTGRRSSR